MQFWPRGVWFGMSVRLRRLSLRVIIAALVLITLLVVLVRAYVEYEVYRVTTMLAEVWRVQIGDTEASVFPLVQRYGGHSWVPERRSDLGSREDWINQWAYEYRLRTMSDHAYVFDVNPWGFPNGAGVLWGQRSRLDEMLRAAIDAVPAGVRPVFGMRDWNAQVQISIRSGRVSRVSTMVLVGNRGEWLEHESALAKEMPYEELQSRTYAIGAASLTMGKNPGSAILNYLTPEASEEQVRAAHSFNVSCLTSVKDCNGFCDLAPRATRYLEKHPDAADNIISPRCQ